MTSILIVDDDPRIRSLLTEYLSRNGFQVQQAANATEMRSALRRGAPNLLLLDLDLPDGNGLDLIREVRGMANIPIIMISGHGEAMDRVIGLEVGADDYLPKPFLERELLARVHSVLRRAPGTDATPAAPGRPEVEFEGWRFDRAHYRLIAPNGAQVELSSHELQLLDLLVTHAHRVLSREKILSSIVDREWTPSDRSVDVAIGKLRRKLGDDPAAPRLIKTIRGLGYTFTGEVTSPTQGEAAD